MVMSPVDILDPDYERFPLFRGAKRLQCVLRPGDVLFMPAFWWHEVQSYPDPSQKRNLAVNYWYVTQAMHMCCSAVCYYSFTLHNDLPNYCYSIEAVVKRPAKLQLHLLTFALSSVVNVVFIGVTKHLDLVIFNTQV